MGEQIIHLLVDLRDDNTVTALKNRVSELETKVLEQVAHINKAEFNLMFEYRVNEQLVDLCKEHGVTIPKRLFQRI